MIRIDRYYRLLIKSEVKSYGDERVPLYRAYSNIQVQTRRTNPSVVVRQIMEQIREAD